MNKYQVKCKWDWMNGMTKKSWGDRAGEDIKKAESSVEELCRIAYRERSEVCRDPQSPNNQRRRHLCYG